MLISLEEEKDPDLSLCVTTTAAAAAPLASPGLCIILCVNLKSVCFGGGGACNMVAGGG